MGLPLSSSSLLILIIFTFTTTPLLYFTSASPETIFSNKPANHKIKPRSKAADDDGSSGVEHVWCVAKNNADDAALQAAIDWACSSGGVNCGAIQTNGSCYDPNNIQSTASYVFNDYFLSHGRTDESCDFSGSAAVSSLDPSHDNCKFSFSTVTVATGSFVAVGSSNDTSGGSGNVGPLLVTIVLFSFAFVAFWGKL